MDAIMTTEITKKNLKKIGSILMEVRKAEGFSQIALAKKMKKQQGFVSNIERTIRIASMPTIVNYLDKLGYKLTIQKQ